MRLFNFPDYYQLLFHGFWPKKVKFTGDQNSAECEILGFYTTRFVAAHNLREAVSKAETSIRQELADQVSVPTTMSKLHLNDEEVQLIGFWRFWLKRPGEGFTFYAND